MSVNPRNQDNESTLHDARRVWHFWVDDVVMWSIGVVSAVLTR